MGDFPNSNLTSIPFPSQEITSRIAWAQKTKNVVNNLMGFPLDIWIFPMVQGFDYFPLRIPCEIMPPYL